MNRKLKLLAVLAHPDDESLGFGGTLARYAAEGVETYLVTATRGERGRFGSLGKSGDPVEVGRVREAELRAAAAVLGIREVSILGYPDGAVDQVPCHNCHSRHCFAHPANSARRDRHLRSRRERYGHPDHIAISQFTTAATVCAADAGYRMDDGSQADSPPPHRVAKAPLPGVAKQQVGGLSSRLSQADVMVDGVERQATPWPDWAVTTEIDTSAFWPIVWKAVCCHQTQMSIYERLEDLTEAQQTALWGSQEFYRAYSSVNGGRNLETDLFEGLR